MATIGREAELLAGLTPKERATLAALLRRMLLSMGRS
jgi:hypothetical protein